MRRPLVLLLAAAVAAWTAWVFASRLGVEAWHGNHGNDFKHLYIGARLVAAGESPYDRATTLEAARLLGLGAVNPYVYLPSTAQALFPLSLLGYAQARAAWFLANHAFIAGGFVLLLLATGAHRRAALLPLALGALATFASFAVYRTLTAGQLNAALFFGYALVFFLLARGRDAAAGSAAAFFALFKITPGLLLPYFLVTRRWRAAAAMAGSGIILVAAGLVITPPATWLEFLPLARDMGFGKSTWGDTFAFYRDPYNQSFNSLFHHLFAAHPETTPWLDLGPRFADRLSLAAALAVLGLVLLAGWKEGRRREATTPAGPVPAAPRLDACGAWGACVLGSLLIPSLYWDHYNTIALAALLPMLWHPSTEAAPARLAVCAAIAILWGLWFPHGAPVYPFGEAIPRGAAWLPDLPVPATHGPGLLLMSLKLWPTLLLFGACVAAACVAPPAAGGEDRSGAAA